MKYSILLWDVDGTLLDFRAAEKAAIRALFEKFHLGECTDEMITIYSGINRKYWERLERGEMTKQEILVGRFREFFALYGLPDVAEAFNADYQVALGDTIIFLDDSLSLLASLRGKVRQYAVTNGTRTAQEKKLTRSGLSDIFDGIFISEDVGAEKPSEAYFNYVKEHIPGFRAEEALIIGDSLTSDIKGGLNAGIDTCWYDGEKKGEEHEQKYGIRAEYRITDLSEILSILG